MERQNIPRLRHRQTITSVWRLFSLKTDKYLHFERKILQNQEKKSRRLKNVQKIMQPFSESKIWNLEQNAVKSHFCKTPSTKMKNGHFKNVQF